ncbi:sensor histidine kinase [Streptomyces rapamycinicus]|uniref:Two-component sensor histidine kinase n=2 Tax=Streptomyces rapamycinicus TaxID=1226757 RepID=A0A0A0NFG9_STRRN|nr:histidine kinase [Streptomyces rapamycinicus]AGP58242.1 histidine kinase [Streptomyces rapamycinicus NRRL 5491]MBB4785924.1 two-component system sensor histidine kinase DesK [Streptomyces rapamycinicus]RLV78615.1 two-component sensor histidine kinase [Streptomyces rapamycinicus NRRL 5491]UTO66060.1 histidine kinase [Streptomyces rapamycinicus]UTP34014.1 histidine kinase [Streptomyces rapamycinicus NRRL 5491]
MYATAARIERLKPPGRRAFVPWLFMLTGDVQALFKGKTPLPWLGGAGVAAFIALYLTTVFTALDERRRHTRTPPLALAGLAAVTYALGIGYAGNWLLCFPLLSLASGIVLRGGRRKLGPVILVLSASAGVIAGLRGGPSDSLTVSYGTMLSGLVTAAILSLFETVAQLRATRQELARTAVEKERLRFSRDLHDLLGHTMSVVVVKAEAVRRLAPKNLEAALGQAADIEAVGRQALTEIREAVTGYREGSLGTELDRARSALDAAGIEAAVRREGPPLAPQTEALLGWVVREGVTNVVRHSGASRCEIEVRSGMDRVRLEITDDGCGVGSRATGTRAAGADGSIGGTGLKGLAERLSAAGGSLESGPAGRRGFRLVAELPVDTEDVVEAEVEGARTA